MIKNEQQTLKTTGIYADTTTHFNLTELSILTAREKLKAAKQEQKVLSSTAAEMAVVRASLLQLEKKWESMKEKAGDSRSFSLVCNDVNDFEWEDEKNHRSECLENLLIKCMESITSTNTMDGRQPLTHLQIYTNMKKRGFDQIEEGNEETVKTEYFDPPIKKPREDNSLSCTKAESLELRTNPIKTTVPTASVNMTIPPMLTQNSSASVSLFAGITSEPLFAPTSMPVPTVNVKHGPTSVTENEVAETLASLRQRAANLETLSQLSTERVAALTIKVRDTWIHFENREEMFRDFLRRCCGGCANGTEESWNIDNVLEMLLM
jgi:hypothetical protein